MKNSTLTLLVFIFSALTLIPNTSESQTATKQRLDSVIYLGANTMMRYFYNDIGQNTVSIHKEWNSSNMIYEKDYKYEYGYDANGNCNKEEFYLWDNTYFEWQKTDSTVFSYDPNYQLLLSNHYHWNDNDSEWNLHSKRDYENYYDDKNRLSEVIIYINNTSGLAIQKYEYKYDSNGNMYEVIQHNKESGQWINSHKYEFNYNNDNDLTERTSSSYLNSGDWKFQSKYEYTYNNLYNFNQLTVNDDYISEGLLLPQDFSIPHMIRNRVYYSYAYSTGWTQEHTKKFYYTTIQTTGLNENQKQVISIYPNPTKNYINIEGYNNSIDSKIEFIDITGNKVFTKYLNNQEKISIKNFSSGIYLVRILENNSIVHTQKMYFQN